jgi:aminopeptidase
MIHPMHEKYAKLLIEYCTEVQQGETVSLNLDTGALPMARALMREVLKADAKPVLHLTYPEMMLDMLELVSDRYLESEPSFELTEIKQVDAWIRVRGGTNNRMLQHANKETLSRIAKRQRQVQNLRLQTKWVGTLYPTDASAQDAGMSLDDYEQFVYGAMYLFEDDPVAKWQELHAFQAQLIERLSAASEVRIVAEGTDLTLNVAGRGWINSDGHHNMPSGEVFTGPLEDSANGHITYGVPSAVNGVEVDDIRITFKDGKAVEAVAAKGDDLLQAQLGSDDGARFLGELGIGTNYNIQIPTKSILYDEKIGGTVHLALGQSYKETGGVNESAIHWDMICDLRQGGAIYLDGEVFQENGQFKL